MFTLEKFKLCTNSLIIKARDVFQKKYFKFSSFQLELTVVCGTVCCTVRCVAGYLLTQNWLPTVICLSIKRLQDKTEPELPLVDKHDPCLALPSAHNIKLLKLKIFRELVMQSTAKLLAGAAGLTTAFVAGGLAKDKYNQVIACDFYSGSVWYLKFNNFNTCD